MKKLNEVLQGMEVVSRDEWVKNLAPIQSAGHGWGDRVVIDRPRLSSGGYGEAVGARVETSEGNLYFVHRARLTKWHEEKKSCRNRGPLVDEVNAPSKKVMRKLHKQLHKLAKKGLKR